MGADFPQAPTAWKGKNQLEGAENFKKLSGKSGFSERFDAGQESRTGAFDMMTGIEEATGEEGKEAKRDRTEDRKGHEEAESNRARWNEVPLGGTAFRLCRMYTVRPFRFSLREDRFFWRGLIFTQSVKEHVPFYPGVNCLYVK
jgi:hypothetical protein